MTFYVSATPDYTQGVVCADSVTVSAYTTHEPIVVSCANRLAGTRYISLVKFVPKGATTKSFTVSELQALRVGEKWINGGDAPHNPGDADTGLSAVHAATPLLLAS